MAPDTASMLTSSDIPTGFNMPAMLVSSYFFFRQSSTPRTAIGYS